MFILVNPKLGKIWSNTLTINNNGKDYFTKWHKSDQPDDECDNELGTITSSYEYNGKVYYDIHLDNHEEGCEDLDMNEEGIHFDVIPVEFINLTPHDIKLNDGTVYPATGKIQLTHLATSAAESQGCFMERLKTFRSQKEAQCILFQQWYLVLKMQNLKVIAEKT